MSYRALRSVRSNLLRFYYSKHVQDRVFKRWFFEPHNPTSKKRASLMQTSPKGLFLYNIVTAEELVGLKFQLQSELEQYLNECLDKNRKRKLVRIADDLSDTICHIADLAEFLRVMHPDVDMTIEAREILIEMHQEVEKLNTNKELYERMKEVVEKGDIFETDPAEQYVAQLLTFDFELSGIHLPEKQRHLVCHLNDHILQSGHKFTTNSNLPRVIDKSAVPPEFVHYFEPTDDGQLIVNGYADVQDEFLREFAFKTYLAQNKEQERFLDEVLSCRTKLAETCGFPTYAHRALKGLTAGSPEFVLELLDTMNEMLRDYVDRDVKLMRAIKSADSKRELAMWDVSYYIHKIKGDWLRIMPGEFMPYFSVEMCLNGINLLCENLFGVSLENAKLQPAEVWSPEVFKLEVVHEREGYLGSIYCDFYERVGKPNQDCHYTIRGGRRLPDSTYQNPIVVISLNFPKPTSTAPSLLNSLMMGNLFHEMGHALHSMLGRTEFQHTSGTRCATDFAEVPSVLMERFAADPRVLRKFAKHYKTQEPIPDFLLERLCSSKTICTALELQSQIFYSAVDYAYHTDKTAPGRTTEILADMQTKYYPLPYVDPTAWQLKFSHLIGYGAKYYSYLMSASIASSIWQACFEKNPFDRKMGEKYRRECLSHGGAKPPRTLVEDFLEKEITPRTLSEALVNDIAAKYKTLNRIIMIDK